MPDPNRVIGDKVADHRAEATAETYQIDGRSNDPFSLPWVAKRTDTKLDRRMARPFSNRLWRPELVVVRPSGAGGAGKSVSRQSRHQVLSGYSCL